MNILVTGSAGMIGSYVVKGLIDKGHTVIGVDRRVSDVKLPGLHQVILDLSSKAAVMQLFDDKKIAGCVSYEKHLNQYNVINLDIAWFISLAQRKGIALREVPDQIADAVKEDLLAMDPNLPVDKGRFFRYLLFITLGVAAVVTPIVYFFF